MNTTVEYTPFQSAWYAPMSNRVHLTWSTTRGFRFSGQEHGHLIATSMSDVPGLGLVITLHEEGRSYWSARGDRSYAGAQVHTVLVELLENYHFRGVLLSSAPAAKAERQAAHDKIVRKIHGLDG